MKRLDQVLVELALCESREKAKRAVLAGEVRINGQMAQKPSDTVRSLDVATLAARAKYVSRGGEKLEHALAHFQLVPALAGATALDVGASTGGFTDCLLQHGVKRVYAIDVGQGQLAWKLRQDPRVVVMEKTNARHLTLRSLGAGYIPATWAAIDCSFISLRQILAPTLSLLDRGGHIVALIKPQFEAGKAEADKGAGVIRDPKIHERVVGELQEFVSGELKQHWRGVTESPLLGPAGNKEFLALIEKVD